jgi:hypothetical protein
VLLSIYDASVVRFNPDQISGFPRIGQVLSRPTVTLLAVVAVVLFGCSAEEPTDYTSAHRDAFLAACSSPLEDPRLLSDVCVCVYDRLESEVSFPRFVAISEALAAAESSVDPASMPDELADAVADCMISEADL